MTWGSVSFPQKSTVDVSFRKKVFLLLYFEHISEPVPLLLRKLSVKDTLHNFTTERNTKSFSTVSTMKTNVRSPQYRPACKIFKCLKDGASLTHSPFHHLLCLLNLKANIVTDWNKKRKRPTKQMFVILPFLVHRSLCTCPHISSRNLIKAGRVQTSLPLITWGGGDGCDRRGNDAAGVEGGELLHLNRRHRGNRR